MTVLFLCMRGWVGLVGTEVGELEFDADILGAEHRHDVL